MEFILIILFLYIVILSQRKKVYEYFHPNELQFTVCPSENKEEKGETNISIDRNRLPKVQKGFFTSVIEQTKEKDFSSYFKTPTCSLIQEQPLQVFYGNNIVDYDKDANPIIINPMKDKYSKPLDNYSILYPNIFNDVFVKQHSETIEKDDRF